MSVADRIAHVEAFLAAMRRQRDRVIRLTMFEIGKTLKDSTAVALLGSALASRSVMACLYLPNESVTRPSK